MRSLTDLFSSLGRYRWEFLCHLLAGKLVQPTSAEATARVVEAILGMTSLKKIVVFRAQGFKINRTGTTDIYRNVFGWNDDRYMSFPKVTVSDIIF